MSLSDVETPALLIDMAALEANLQRMNSVMEAYPAVSIRPHATTHKTVELASLQMQQSQTIGVGCRQVSEVVAMSETCGDVLLSNELLSEMKARRLAAVARRGCSVSAVVDSRAGIEVLATAARVEGVRVGVLVDLNMGQDRCGVDTPAELVGLASEIDRCEMLQFRGIQAYDGLAQHLRTHGERAAASRRVAVCVEEMVGELREHGYECEIVTGGGTGTFELDAASGVFTEVQPGSYVFGDADCTLDVGEDGKPISYWRQSLFVLATVISRRASARRVVLDAGIKAVSYDSGPPLVQGWEQEDVRVESGGDEHTILHVGVRQELPALGDQVLLVPGHCDPTVNMHDHLLSVRNDTVEAVWPVTARGPGL